MKNVYLDNNATTMVAPEVADAMQPFFRDLWGNPSSMHYFGGQVRKHIERAREQVASLINADPGEIVFTSCGTESDNSALRGSVAVMDPRTRIITSRVEHPAVLGHPGPLGCVLRPLGRILVKESGQTPVRVIGLAAPPRVRRFV